MSPPWPAPPSHHPHISLLVGGSEALGFFPDAVALAVAQLQSAPTPAPADAPATSPTVEPLPPALPAAARIAILHVGYGKACRGWACVGAPNVTRVHFSVTVSTPSQLAYAAARLAAVVQVHSSPRPSLFTLSYRVCSPPPRSHHTHITPSHFTRRLLAERCIGGGRRCNVHLPRHHPPRGLDPNRPAAHGAADQHPHRTRIPPPVPCAYPPG